MPTGYTADITEKNITFQQYAMNCARAFGALILMRDEPMDAPIPAKFEPDTHYVKCYKGAIAETARLSRMTPKQQDAFGAAKKAEAVKSAKEWLARAAADNAKYAAMREQVQAWEPPTQDHVELKSFMLQQIDISTSDTSYAKQHVAECEASTPNSYYRSALDTQERNIKYYGEQLEKEKERATGRTEWVQQLRKSLEMKP